MRTWNALMEKYSNNVCHKCGEREETYTLILQGELYWCLCKGCGDVSPNELVKMETESASS